MSCWYYSNTFLERFEVIYFSPNAIGQNSDKRKTESGAVPPDSQKRGLTPLQFCFMCNISVMGSDPLHSCIHIFSSLLQQRQFFSDLFHLIQVDFPDHVSFPLIHLPHYIPPW